MDNVVHGSASCLWLILNCHSIATPSYNDLAGLQSQILWARLSVQTRATFALSFRRLAGLWMINCQHVKPQRLAFRKDRTSQRIEDMFEKPHSGREQRQARHRSSCPYVNSAKKGSQTYR